MLSVDDIEAIADALTPAMRHVLGRCSEAGFWASKDHGCWREWRDVIDGRPYTSFHGTIGALERRGLVVVNRFPGLPGSMVAMTRTGLRVSAALRLRG